MLLTLPADDGCMSGGLCLSGHLDTVPVDGQNWSSDPFSASLRDAMLYGRGACDMKGFVGTALAVAMARANRPRRKPLHLALSYDEELGCAGAPSLVADMIARGIVPEGCIVGEPTMMAIVTAHKGANVGRLHVEGLARHSSRAPEGINAIEHAASFVLFLRNLADGFERNGPFDTHFDVPFTTMQTGRIQGGIAVNTVPAECSLDFEFRNLPGVSADLLRQTIIDYVDTQMRPAMRKDAAAGRARVEWPAAAPAFETDETSRFTRLARTVIGDMAIRKVAYGTEAGLFAQAGIPTLVCGPGNIAVAHTADEYVSLEQLARCETVLHALADAL
jgi:acetylornithine deacetylase